MMNIRLQKLICMHLTEIALWNMATIIVKQLKKQGLLKEIDESEEINACSIVVDVDVNGKDEPWLIMFKNETHNHPTEIEPFGGAATCLGGAIRDPLSGRSYVYQAMRVTGAAVIREFPKRIHMPESLCRERLQQVRRQVTVHTVTKSVLQQDRFKIYDEGYVAKRMEIGAVIGAAPKKNVIREVPSKGRRYYILLGGRTGRDGIGGATGSSKGA